MDLPFYNNRLYTTVRTESGVREIIEVDSGGGGGGSIDTSNFVTKNYLSTNHYTKTEIDNMGTGGTLTDARPTPVALGGVAKGTTFNKVANTEVLRTLLYPYQDPTIDTFSTPKTSLVIGETLTSPITVTWKIGNVTNVKANGVNLKLDNKVIGSNIGNSGNNSTFPIDPITLTSRGSKQLVITVTNTNNKDISKTITISWHDNIYYGSIDKETITANDISSLSSVTASSISRKYSFPAGGYKWLVTPKDMPASSFIDAVTLFEVAMNNPTELEITNQYGVTKTYYVYRSTNRLGGSIDVNIK